MRENWCQGRVHDTPRDRHPHRQTSPGHLPATLEPGALTPTVQTAYRVPAPIGNLGEAAAWRYVEFFTANIHNPKTTPGERLQRRFDAPRAFRALHILTHPKRAARSA
jgi:hypothetical protein